MKCASQENGGDWTVTDPTSTVAPVAHIATILEELGRIGYWVEWQTLNSKHYGVPQNRERVFIVGHLRGSGTRQIFPAGQTGKSTTGSCGTAQSEGPRVRTANSLNCSESGKERNLIERKIVQACLTPDRINKRQNGRRFKEDGEPSFTLTGQDVHGVAIGYRRIRRLTPVECERLQGFPDGWTQKGLTKEGKEIDVSDTQRYKLCGNAVSTPVITFLGELLKDCLEEKTCENIISKMVKK